MVPKLMKLFMVVPYIANNFITSHVSLFRGIFGWVRLKLCLKKLLVQKLIYIQP